MRNPIIILLLCITTCAVLFVAILSRDVKIIVKENKELKATIDSLNQELSIRDIDYGRYDMILEKFSKKYPKEFDQYLNETE